MLQPVQLNFFRVEVTPLKMGELHRVIFEAVAENEKKIIANHNLHSVYLWHHDPKMRSFYHSAGVVYIDGMSLVLSGILQGLPLRPEHRLTTIDWMPSLLSEAAKRKLRVFFLGARPEVIEKSVAQIRQAFPGLDVDSHHGYFALDSRHAENLAVLERIALFQPHILLVGMGMPRQEQWIADNFSRLPICVIMNLGGYMDYVAGVVPMPPRWLGRLGLEWLFRLLCEPRRLWRRYLIEPWFFLGLLLKGWLFRIKA